MEKLKFMGNITAKLVVCWSTASLNNIASTKREPFITMKDQFQNQHGSKIHWDICLPLCDRCWKQPTP